jgi:hypothetical protein
VPEAARHDRGLGAGPDRRAGSILPGAVEPILALDDSDPGRALDRGAGHAAAPE